jgi:hypothetical protein
MNLFSESRNYPGFKKLMEAIVRPHVSRVAQYNPDYCIEPMTIVFSASAYNIRVCYMTKCIMDKNITICTNKKFTNVIEKQYLKLSLQV